MENQKTREYYQKLYIEYKELKKKTALKAQDLKPGGKIETKRISIKDLKRRIEVEEELLKSLDFLSDDQLIELSGDYSFYKKTYDILRKKRMAE